MVICQHFLNNSCRFGSKCHNDHIDLCQLIKTEVETAEKGSQWPLSNFGPIKEKPCLPNFIEDQSFEEIRFNCLEAKRLGTFQMFEYQLKQQIMDAKNKMNALLQYPPDIMNAIITMYNQNSSNNGFNKSATNTTAAPNPFALNNQNSGTSNNNSAFQTPSVFGGGGGGNTSVFGGAPTATDAFGAKPSIFGGAATATGAPANQNPFASTGGMFGATQPQGAASPFQLNQMTAAQPTSVFGGMQQQPNPFAAQASLPFGGGAQMMNTTAPTPGFFSQATNALPATNVFGGGQPQQPSVFGGQSAFNQPSQPNVFNQIQQQQPAPVASNAFVASTGSNIFASPFSQQQQQSQMIKPQEPQQQFNAAVQNVSSSVYSQMETLSPDICAVFKADVFDLGKIPTMPPPKELCY